MKDASLPGLAVYLVGGAVRDELLGIPVVERDWVIVGASPEQVLAAGFRALDEDFPVFLHPQTGEEYALARRETKIGPGYRGFALDAGPQVSLVQDLARRDLTINAMAKSPDGRIVDPFGGRADLAARVLRHVTPAFGEDPVRLLRIARFAAKLGGFGFGVASSTLDLLRVMGQGSELRHLRPERLWRELRAALGTAHPWRFFEVLGASGALASLLPELAAVNRRAADGRRVSATSNHLVELLRSMVDLGAGTCARFAILVAAVGQPTEREALRRRLPAERDCYELADQVAATHALLPQLAARDAAAWFSLLKGWRTLAQPQRFAEVLRGCRVLAGDAYPQVLDQLYQDVLQGAAKVEVKAVLEAGFSGAQIGRELDRRRIAQIDRALQCC